MVLSYKSKYKIKYCLAFSANVIYFSVFLFAIFIQLFRLPSPLSAKDLLLINVLMVLSARITLFLLALHELNCTNSNTDKNSLTKYKKIAHVAELVSTTIAIVIQAIAITNVAMGNLEIVATNKSVIHTKGAVDFACILIKLLITSPLLIYFHYHKTKENKDISKKNKLDTLFYLSIAILVINFIAFTGKIINVLEQTQSFALFNTKNYSNNGPNNFPLGPIIRISCIIASIITLAIMLNIESSINSGLSDVKDIKYEKLNEPWVAKEGFEPTAKRL